MSLALFVAPKWSFQDDDGAPASGWLLYTYEPGTSTAKTAYQDSDGTAAHTNPIVLDSRGEAEIWLDGAYKFVLKTAGGVTKWTSDDVTGYGGGLQTGYLTKSVAGNANVALTASEQNYAVIEFTGLLTGNINVTVGDDKDGYRWILKNSTTGSYTITFKTTSGTGVVVGRTLPEMVYSDASNIVRVPWREAASVKDFGAVGDGVTDDTAAIQAAFDSGYPLIVTKGNYRITAPVYIPSNFHMECDTQAWFIKDFSGSGIFKVYNEKTVNGSQYVYIKNLQVESTTYRGNVVQLIGVRDCTLDGLNILNTTPEGGGGVGAWSLFISGEDIEINSPYIESSAAGLYGDGIHVDYVRNLRINGGYINAGDDAIALHFPSSTWDTSYKNDYSNNIMINDVQLGSAVANILRIGAESDANAACVWKNVRVSNIQDVGAGKTGTPRNIAMQDLRASGSITGQHENISVSFAQSARSTSGGNLGITGNPDISDSTYRTQYNYKNIDINGMTLVREAATGAIAYCGGVQDLRINNVSYDSAVAASVTELDFYSIDTVVLANCDLRANTTATGIAFAYCATVILDNNDVSDNSASFRQVNIKTNALQGTAAYVTGGRYVGSARGFDNTDAGAVAFTSLYVFGALVEGSTSGFTAAFMNYTAGRIENKADLPSVSADKGDAAATLTVGSSDKTNIWNTALTADRAVTLSTTNAYKGAKFRVVRTANATGAFNLNVGTGPLKAMGTAGSFCDVEYNGSAWVLTAYGTL